MYATCTFCHLSLGSNETLEAFPVGKRLAFDSAKGRLWVVCTGCGRWNLTPLEERWEAIESAERQFRSTVLRRSTENIGLARMTDGTDLVRVGKPLRPEMAAWRYGDQFENRRRGAMWRSGMFVAGAGAVALFNPLTGIAAGVIAAVAAVSAVAATMHLLTGESIMLDSKYFRDDEGQYLRITGTQLPTLQIVGEESNWGLRMIYMSRRPTLQGSWGDWVDNREVKYATIHGANAIEAVRQVLPYINGLGASPNHVLDSVKLLDEWGDPSRALPYAAANARRWMAHQTYGDQGSLHSLPKPVQLALEMAVNESREQMALDGELAELQRAWEEAETVANISDKLVVPLSVSSAFDRISSKSRNRR